MVQRGPRHEIEIKLCVPSAVQARRLLRAKGFRLVRRRHHEDNLVFDTAGSRLHAAGILLRLRRIGRLFTLTIKHPLPGRKHKRRLEIEGTVRHPSALLRIFECLGFTVSFRYEKYRTEFASPSAPSGLVTLDETPIGDFLELEGPPSWIDRTARRLGFGPRDYITASYGQLFRSRRSRLGLGRHMIFASTPPRESVAFLPDICKCKKKKKK